MKQIVFTKSDCKCELLHPFSLTRRVQDFRVGGLTIREKWERSLKLPSYDLKEESHLPDNDVTIDISQLNKDRVTYLISCNLLPDKELVKLITKLKPGEAIVNGENQLLARALNKTCFHTKGHLKIPVKAIVYHQAKLLSFFLDILTYNKEALLYDFELLTQKRKSAALPKSNAITNSKNAFVEKGAQLHHCIINATEGPVYIGKNALIMEGACLRGPIFIGDHTVVKMGAKIYGATSIGPGCTIGGEIKNVIMFANSNKAHDGYMGDSVIGEWCNWGAGTSNSNLKNNAGDIDYHLGDTVYVTNQKKVGVMMGDYSKTAINTSINTGTLIGVHCNVFGNGLTPKIIPNFSWGFNTGAKYELDKALRDAEAWKALKGLTLTEAEKQILITLYNKK